MSLVSDAVATGLGGRSLTHGPDGARLPDGTLAGRSAGLDHAVRTFAGIAGRDAALAAVTEIPARLLGLDDGRGTLRVGGRADIVLLTGDLDVAATIVGGRVAFRSPGRSCSGSGSGREHDPPPIGERDAPTHGREPPLDRLGIGAPEVAAAAGWIEAPISLRLRRPLPLEHREEVLSRSRPQVEDVRPGVDRAGVARGGEDRREVARRIGQAGQDRGDRDPGGDAGIGQEPDGAQPLAGRGDARLEPGGQRLRPSSRR